MNPLLKLYLQQYEDFLDIGRRHQREVDHCRKVSQTLIHIKSDVYSKPAPYSDRILSAMSNKTNEFEGKPLW